MIRTSYHTHNRFCDGAGAPEDYAEAALAAGLEALGISCHSPLTFPDAAAMKAENLAAYCAEVARLREAYRGRLRVHLSLEFDYIPDRHAELWAMVAAHQDAAHQDAAHQDAALPFEYLIGSVHFVGRHPDGIPWPVDLTRAGFEQGLRDYYGGDIRRLVGAYYEQVQSLIAWGGFAIVGHIDRIKKWNDAARYFDEDDAWYRREVEATLQVCARTPLIVEINTVGWRNAVGSAYPSPWIIRRCLDLKIPLVVTTDAHAPQRVTDYHAEAETLLREVGCRELAVLRDDGWRIEPVAT